MDTLKRPCCSLLYHTAISYAHLLIDLRIVCNKLINSTA